MKKYNDFICDSPFWKRVWFGVLIAFIYGVAWNIKEIINDNIISNILQIIFFFIGAVTLDRYAYWIYKNNIKNK